uniref:Uncharacterized protein n=1 Tax=Amphimedon queenslandica TaxID=400682 RepID=A0A1X7TPX0_AMPQE
MSTHLNKSSTNYIYCYTCIIKRALFSITGKLSDLLQSEQLNYAAAATCIEATKITLVNLRTESEWQLIWDTAVQLAESNDVTVSTISTSRQRRVPFLLSHSVIEETTGGRADINQYRTSVYYATIDSLLGELNSRFSETNISLLQSLHCLVPSSPSFLHVPSLLPFLNHYDINVVYHS